MFIRSITSTCSKDFARPAGRADTHYDTPPHSPQLQRLTDADWPGQQSAVAMAMSPVEKQMIAALWVRSHLGTNLAAYPDDAAMPRLESCLQAEDRGRAKIVSVNSTSSANKKNLISSRRTIPIEPRPKLATAPGPR
jgi:hypothetical protein